MNARKTLALAPLFTLALGTAAPVTAQDAPSPQVLKAQAEENQTASPTFDVHLVRPKLGELCEFLSEVAATPEKPINIVVPDEAKHIPLPSMQVRRVTLKQFASFLNQLGRTHPENRFQFQDNDGIWFVYQEPSSRKASPLQTRVLHIGSHPDATLGLIDEAFAVTQREYAPKLKYHQPSQSLIVTATEDDLRLVSEVVEQMEKVQLESEQAREQEARASSELAVLQAELDRRHAEIQQLKEQVSGLHTRLAEQENINRTMRRQPSATPPRPAKAR